MRISGRKTQRRKTQQPVLMKNHDGSVIGPGTMLDVSAGGARLKLEGDLQVPDEFILLLSKFNSQITRRCRVAWREEQRVGVRFLPA